jgi:predicted XRE-type DNA-binding protein
MKHEVYENASDAIEDDAGERECLKLRSQLMFELERHINRQKWTQAESAKRLGVTQPRISNLMRGKINAFSLDLLVRMAAAAGLRVTLKLEKTA